VHTAVAAYPLKPTFCTSLAESRTVKDDDVGEEVVTSAVDVSRVALHSSQDAWEPTCSQQLQYDKIRYHADITYAPEK